MARFVALLALQVGTPFSAYWLGMVAGARITQMPTSKSLDAAIDELPSAPSLELLPSVHCIRYITIEGSSDIPLFEAQMRQLGLWSRVTVQESTPDPEGKSAGCFRAHVRAWQESLAQGCSKVLVLEEDAFFENRTVRPVMQHAESFIRGGRPFDMLFFGWGAALFGKAPQTLGVTAVVPIPDFRCIFMIHHWLDTHAYIISDQAMQLYQNLAFNETQYGPETPIDVVLEKYFDRDRFFVTRPQCAFQRAHPYRPAENITNPTMSDVVKNLETHIYEDFASYPSFVREVVEDPIYKAANVTWPWTSCI